MGAAALPAAVGLQAGGGLFSAYMQGQAGKSQQGYYNYLADTATQNASLSKAVADSNLKALGYQNMQEERQLNNKIRGVQGAQLAAVAAGGAGASSKTAEQITLDTASKGNLDEMALRYNAALKAKAIRSNAMISEFNYKNEAAGDILAGSNARKSSEYSAIGTILGSGAGIASSFQRFPGYGGYAS